MVQYFCCSSISTLWEDKKDTNKLIIKENQTGTYILQAERKMSKIFQDQ